MRKSYWFLGHRQTIIAGPADTEGRYDLAEGWFPAGTQIPPHRHRRYSEHFYVLEGELTVWVGRRKVVLRPGDDLFIPPGTAHAFHVTGDGPWRALAVASPSGFARLVTEVGTPDDGSGVPPSVPTDVDLLQRVSAELGDEDRERGVRFALRVEAGMTHVNDHSVDDAPTGPFGGEKTAGSGGSVGSGSCANLRAITG